MHQVIMSLPEHVGMGCFNSNSFGIAKFQTRESIRVFCTGVSRDPRFSAEIWCGTRVGLNRAVQLPVK